MTLKLLSTITLILLTCWGSVPSASAQLGGLSAAEKRKRSREAFKTASVAKPESIPNVPFFPAQPGKFKFIRGLRYASMGEGANCIVQTILFKEPPDVIRDWYRQTLPSYQWVLQSGNPANTQILARRIKEGASCHIMVSNSPQKDFKSLVQIRYVQFHPLDDQ